MNYLGANMKLIVVQEDMYGSCAKHTIKIGLVVAQLSMTMLLTQCSMIVADMNLTKKLFWKESRKL